MQIRGLEFNVQTSGDGPAFVWGHGLSTSIASENILDWFQWGSFPEDVQLVRYDARGHGDSQLTEQPEDYHWRNLGQDMLAVADAVDVESFVAGGASMGCATTIYAALQAPERIKGMVLVIPPTAWETRAGQGKLYKRFSQIGGLLGGKGMVRMMSMMGGGLDRMLPGWLVENEPDKLLGVAEGMAAQKGKALKNIFLGAALTDLPPRDALKTLAEIPCQILAWVDDPTHPVSSAEELHRLLPNSALFIAQGYEDFKTIPGRVRDFVMKHG